MCSPEDRSRTVKMILYALAALASVTVGLGVYVRLAPSEARHWHVDPAATPDTGAANFARADLILPGEPAQLAARLAAVAEADGAVVLAGDGLHRTWISRSRLMGYPDYTSIRLEPAEGGTRLVALARSRFGQNDWGVNRARLDRWIAALRAL
jgi:hypothetical protein